MRSLLEPNDDNRDLPPVRQRAAGHPIARLKGSDPTPRAVLPRTVPAIHLPARTRVDTRPPLKLCQEFWIRTSRYDDLARVTFRAGAGIELRPRLAATGAGDYTFTTEGVAVINTTFHHGVASVGLEAALRALHSCLWCSRSDFQSTEPIDCAECLEVAHS